MRTLLLIGGVVIVAVIALTAAGFAHSQDVFPDPSSEVTQLTPEKRVVIGRLRTEAKFAPHEFWPLGYTGAATPEDGALATSAVDEMLDGVLGEPDGPLEAKTVIRFIATAMRKVDELETEDRDRAADYMLEAWYLLGFRGATGQFAYGAAHPRPSGYEEPLPAGWKSPTEPRPIN